MGKSEVEKLHTLSITMSGQGTETQPWNNRDEKEKTATGVATVSLSSGVEVFKNQVAGHMTNGQHYGESVNDDAVDWILLDCFVDVYI